MSFWLGGTLKWEMVIFEVPACSWRVGHAFNGWIWHRQLPGSNKLISLDGPCLGRWPLKAHHYCNIIYSCYNNDTCYRWCYYNDNRVLLLAVCEKAKAMNKSTLAPWQPLETLPVWLPCLKLIGNLEIESLTTIVYLNTGCCCYCHLKSLLINKKAGTIIIMII